MVFYAGIHFVLISWDSKPAELQLLTNRLADGM